MATAVMVAAPEQRSARSPRSMGDRGGGEGSVRGSDGTGEQLDDDSS